MDNKIETVIIGAGQAGLSVGYHLKQLGREFTILEKANYAGSVWRDDRWDSFCLNTPNWAFRLPGAEYSGNEPYGFMPVKEIVSRFDQYEKKFNLPIQYSSRVESVESDPQGGFQVRTQDGWLTADHVVVATGLFQKPKIPEFAGNLPSEILQTHSGQYRNLNSIPAGAVLVVGSGQSGCQIAEELYQAGARVYMSVGGAGRVPRRYRGSDIVDWLNAIGFFDRTIDKLPDPSARFQGNLQVSGTKGGHALNLHQFAHDGVSLLGHLRGSTGNRIILAPDLKQNLARADSIEKQLIQQIDSYIEGSGLNVPVEILPQPQDGFSVEEVTELDLKSEGIQCVIWSAGYRFDYSFIRLPVFDRDGFPVTRRGETQISGLFFVGMPWIHTVKSGLLLGVGEDAAWIASRIAA